MLYVHLPLAPEEVDYLKQQVGDLELHLAQQYSETDNRASCMSATLVLGNPPPEWLLAAPRLRWVQLSSAGFGQYTQLANRELSFTITNSADLFGVPVAETALAGILALLRGLPELILDKEQRKWEGTELRPRLSTLTGKKVVVLGTGSIGGTFRRLLEGLNCTVESMGRHEDADFRGLQDLDARLPGADVVVATLPDTPQTRDMFNRERIALLSTTCIFVNVGRGSLVDEAALLERLTAGTLGGAVLDVTRHEPLADDDPLWAAPRTILTQHSGGGAQEENRKIIDRFLMNYALFRAGKPLKYRVDLEQGY